MAVTKAKTKSVTLANPPLPKLNKLALACHQVITHFTLPTPRKISNPIRTASPSKTLQAFCLSALALPGMQIAEVQASSEDEVGYQYGHYEEMARPLYSPVQNADFSMTGAVSNLKNLNKPITVDSEHGYARFHIGDRIRFAFDYSKDVWSGATPINTAPLFYQANIAGVRSQATPYAALGLGNNLFDANGRYMYPTAFTTDTSGNQVAAKFGINNRLQHLMGYASPEIRNQFNAKLGYDWDNAALDIGAGTSIEHDYESRFGNLAARFDFNQKRTTVNTGLSYTSSDTHAIAQHFWDPVLLNPANYILDNTQFNSTQIIGNRRDAAISLALSQVINKNDVWNASFSYTRSSGFQSNPYKSVAMYILDPNWRTDGSANAFLADPNSYPGAQFSITGGYYIEKRPELRNQFTWDTSYLHYIEALDAATKLDYSFFHDDWGINAHTFTGEWRQNLGGGWSITPHMRYYSQSKADFYAPYFFATCTQGNASDCQPSQNNLLNVPAAFSSDQRLSAFGTLSGGITLAKQFAKGLHLQLGFEYYTHAGSLKMGGGGEADYANFQYFVANAGISADLSQLAKVSAMLDTGQLFSEAAEHKHNHRQKHPHGAAPAGVMFAHMLDEPGQFMLGYRYMYNSQAGNMLSGSHAVSTPQFLKQACPATVDSFLTCQMLPTQMSMNMHMLDFMYAPTDWLNIMLMPQFTDMSMNMDMYMDMHTMMRTWGMYGFYGRDNQSSGGFGDTGGYLLFKLWQNGNHHLHMTHGISAPTGAVTNKFGLGAFNYYSYDMQQGSGTWDYKPSITYTGHLDDWFWGAQISGTHRLQNQTSYGWSLGDVWQGTSWGGYQFLDWLSGTVRAAYTAQSAIHGQYSLYTSDSQPLSTVYGVNSYGTMPNDFSKNYGGSFVDIGLGLSATVPDGAFAGHTFNFEWLQPVYTYMNGYQLDRATALSASWSYAF